MGITKARALVGFHSAVACAMKLHDVPPQPAQSLPQQETDSRIARPVKPHMQVTLSNVRAGRIGEQIVDWSIWIVRRDQRLTFDLIDWKDWYRTVDDESVQPNRGTIDDIATALSRAWCAKIQQAAKVSLLLPRYIWGYPASLKSAPDHLSQQRTNKPAAKVGDRAHTRRSTAADRIALALKRARFIEPGRLADPTASLWQSPRRPGRQERNSG